MLLWERAGVQLGCQASVQRSHAPSMHMQPFAGALRLVWSPTCRHLPPCCLCDCTAALSAHPLVSFLAGQLLADLVAAAGSSELASQQLALLHKLMGASAAAAALPGASWDACPVVDTLTAVLQVCLCVAAMQMFAQCTASVVGNGDHM